MSYRLLVIWLALCCGFLAGLAVGVTLPKRDNLVDVPAFNYTNTFPGYTIVCTGRGTRASFAADGTDITPGDRLVRDCTVAARG